MNENLEDIKREANLILCRVSDIERNIAKILMKVEKLEKET